jgi:asparagine synthase (glutamine-hydrolysing)
MPWNVRVEAAFMGLDQQHWLPYDVLVKADRASMLASLEMRTPYLHHELAELAATIPLRVHTRKRGKHILREVLARTGLPFEHRAPKQAFRVPLSNWLRTSVAGTFSEQLATSSAYSEGWFDRGAVKQLFEAHRAGKADHSQVLWPVFAFACWLDGWRTG